jgi:RNA polymerase sigma-70 factor (ECF subfamily)
VAEGDREEDLGSPDVSHDKVMSAVTIAITSSAPAVDGELRVEADPAALRARLPSPGPAGPANAPTNDGPPPAPAASGAAPPPPPPLDPRAFDALIREHLPRLRARAMQLCRDHCNAEDLLQEALSRACRKLDTLRDPASVRPWLLKILATTFIDSLRAQRKRPRTVTLEAAADAEPEDHEAAEPLPWEHVTTAQLHAAIARLSAGVRNTYRMRELEGMSYDEIATILDIPKSTVGTRLVRAREKLHALLAPGGEDPT